MLKIASTVSGILIKSWNDNEDFTWMCRFLNLNQNCIVQMVICKQ